MSFNAAAVNVGSNQSAQRWTFGNTLTLLGIIVAVLGIAASLYIATRIASHNQHDHWQRDRRADAYITVLQAHQSRSTWRLGANHGDLVSVEPLDRALADAKLQLFGSLDARALAARARIDHSLYASAVLTFRSEIQSGTTPLSVTREDLSGLSATATDSERMFFDQARVDLDLP